VRRGGYPASEGKSWEVEEREVERKVKKVRKDLAFGVEIPKEGLKNREFKLPVEMIPLEKRV
jgi:hypothetical protein